MPAGRDDFRRELTSCLALCGASGMTEDNRNEWLKVAWQTLRDLPADLLKRGCDVARKYCDHPSKIVPAIMREIDEPLRNRRRIFAEKERADRPQPEKGICTPEQACAILDEYGLRSAYAPPVDRGPPRTPTAADYLAMGVDPAHVSSIPPQKMRADPAVSAWDALEGKYDS